MGKGEEEGGMSLTAIWRNKWMTVEAIKVMYEAIVVPYCMEMKPGC